MSLLFGWWISYLAICWNLGQTPIDLVDTWFAQQRHLVRETYDKVIYVRFEFVGPPGWYRVPGSDYLTWVDEISFYEPKDGSPIDLSVLKDFPTVRSVSITSRKAPIAHWETLAQLPNLRAVLVGGSALDNDALRHIGKIKNLRELSVMPMHTDLGPSVSDRHQLEYPRIDENGFAFLRGMPRLQAIQHNLVLTDIGIDHLATLPNLLPDVMITEDLSAKGIQQIRDKLKPKYLTLNRPHDPAWAETLADHPTLTAIRTRNAPLTDAQAQLLLNAKLIRDISIQNSPITDRLLPVIKSRPNRGFLELIGTQITGKGLLKTFADEETGVVIIGDEMRLTASIRQRDPTNTEMAYAREVHNIIWQGKVDAEMLTGMQDFQQLGSFQLETSLDQPVDFQFLGNSPRLWQLKIWNYPFDLNLPDLNQVVRLEAVRFGNVPKLSVSDLRRLTRLPRLESLTFQSCRLTKSHLEVIGRMAGLKTIYCNQVQLDESGLPELLNLKKLWHVTLADCSQLPPAGGAVVPPHPLSEATIGSMKVLRVKPSAEDYSTRRIERKKALPRRSDYGVFLFNRWIEDAPAMKSPFRHQG
ncbi:hypothetical protein AB1L30_06135 [Bremerella sp. JC817]|uniref:hypothetical protein n=1 Tax=Bremerella sp. JC817 TaxID=3231756 RepID=UPI00345B43AB